MNGRRFYFWLALLLALLLFPLTAYADSAYNEGDDGDLSGDRTAPTALALSTGQNRLVATSVRGDLEYVAITLPHGAQLEQLVVTSFVSTDPIAFAGIQAGAQFTEPNTGTDATKLLGYAHFGTGPNNVGTNILDEMGVGSGAIGFTGPLSGSVYESW